MDFDNLISRANSNDSLAIFQLVDIYRHGLGVKPIDVRQSVRWAQSAARLKHPIGLAYVGFITQQPELFRRATMFGLNEPQFTSDARALWLRSKMFKHGLGAEKDSMEESRLLILAAKMGSLDAQCELAIQLIKRDDKEAIPVLTVALEQQSAVAQYLYAYCLNTGKFVKHDMNKAWEIVRLSAEQNHTPAQLALYESSLAAGLHEPQHYVEAAKWAKRAANNGHAEGFKALGALHEHGHGVEKSVAKAVTFFYLAATNGLDECRDLASGLLSHATKWDIDDKKGVQFNLPNGTSMADKILVVNFPDGSSLKSAFGAAKILADPLYLNDGLPVIPIPTLTLVDESTVQEHKEKLNDSAPQPQERGRRTRPVHKDKTP